MGAGKTFMWKGKSYSTNIAGEGKSKPKGFSVDMAKSAIDKAVGVKKPTASTPRPKARPTDSIPTSKGIRTPKPYTTPDILTSKIYEPKPGSPKTPAEARARAEARRKANMKPPIGKGGR